MLEPEVATLADILLKGVNVTNSETQAVRWAREIIDTLEKQRYKIVPLSGE